MYNTHLIPVCWVLWCQSLSRCLCLSATSILKPSFACFVSQGPLHSPRSTRPGQSPVYDWTTCCQLDYFFFCCLINNVHFYIISQRLLKSIGNLNLEQTEWISIWFSLCSATRVAAAGPSRSFTGRSLPRAKPKMRRSGLLWIFTVRLPTLTTCNFFERI